MEEVKLSGVEISGSGEGNGLNPGIINAVSNLIASSIGKESEIADLFPAVDEEEKDVDPSQLAMALAYTQLCLDEPDMVTSRHLKMLRRNFTFEQIQELNSIIRKLIE